MSQAIELRNSETGESFEWECPDELWIDLQAFAEASGLTIEEVIRYALTAFFEDD